MKQSSGDGVSSFPPACAERKPRDSKQRLLETACNLIARASYGSVSVDDLCHAAQLKKGSFYYFFKSKAELAVASLEYSWEEMQAHYEIIFAPTNTPLQRLEKYFDYVIDLQTEKRKKYGCVIGCAFTAIGCELSSQEESIRKKVEEINRSKYAYLAVAIHDGQMDGSVANATPADQLAEELQSLVLGTVLCGRIRNSLAPVYTIRDSARQLLAIARLEPALSA
ncbi:MAG: TetR/AcrR family transcriptional regulator [Verrucomicrobiales bacterium]|jgi:TetR/AcrR family transcriptional repressor of nem operon|nr:TetR/AcrR family transcriptional regulator [Verrucomicrobiales bacterium]MDR1305674.1 TetR/AcrR family transcriptional regulator [Verrucomicrobiales bacterium]